MWDQWNSKSNKINDNLDKWSSIKIIMNYKQDKNKLYIEHKL